MFTRRTVALAVATVALAAAGAYGANTAFAATPTPTPTSTSAPTVTPAPTSTATPSPSREADHPGMDRDAMIKHCTDQLPAKEREAAREHMEDMMSGNSMMNMSGEMG